MRKIYIQSSNHPISMYTKTLPSASFPPASLHIQRVIKRPWARMRINHWKRSGPPAVDLLMRRRPKSRAWCARISDDDESRGDYAPISPSEPPPPLHCTPANCDLKAAIKMHDALPGNDLAVLMSIEARTRAFGVAVACFGLWPGSLFGVSRAYRGLRFVPLLS